eukprot:TRINITY_DN634_c0_g1_i2.p4 TRINITY_DN634_c0_g1~~TRINITY_DN634_c0_g1_i2.p4  ORF type:complete len:109 (-),score=21.12 TRINITY_DN634_c0_g1_i2:568-894(-)
MCSDGVLCTFIGILFFCHSLVLLKNGKERKMSSKQRHDDDDDNEEQAWESEVGLYDDQLREAVAAKIEEVNSLTNSGKAKQALPIALTDPPILAGDESIKVGERVFFP